MDPLKTTASDAISKAKSLGIEIKILTGDSPEVAGNVAKDIGLIEEKDRVITGSEFDSFSFSEKHEAVEKYRVFARTTPQQKYDTIKLLEEKHSVGFLGEGINDALALKVANVAIAVSEASDVAREVSDILLLKKDLKVIIDGVEGGRRVYENTSKYITSTMSSNFGNFFAIALVTPFINFLSMLPLQILLVNLLSDFPLIMVATDNVDPDTIKFPRTYDLKDFIKKAFSFGLVSTFFDFVSFKTFFSWGEKSLQTYRFIVSILTELFFLFIIRTEKSFWEAPYTSKPLVYLSLVSIFLRVIFPFTEFGRKIFGFIKPNFEGLLIVFGIVFVYMLLNEILKLIFKKVRERNFYLKLI